MSLSDYNFSHRIDQFSFGEETPGIVNPLDGDYKIADTSKYNPNSLTYLFQFFIVASDKDCIEKRVLLAQINENSNILVFL